MLNKHEQIRYINQSGQQIKDVPVVQPFTWRLTTKAQGNVPRLASEVEMFENVHSTWDKREI